MLSRRSRSAESGHPRNHFNPSVPRIGNWVSAQTSPIISNTKRIRTRLKMKPVTIVESENNSKNLEPTDANRLS